MGLTYRVNLDFDKALALDKENYKSDSYNMFEYIFFIVNTDIDAKLFTNVEYDKDYLSYLKSKNFSIPDLVTTCTDYNNWWGNIDNFKNTKDLNSKIVTNEWSKREGLSPRNCCKVETTEELETYIDESESQSFYYRADHGLSGRTNKILDRNKEYSLSYPGVIAPFFKVLITVGITVNLKSKEFYIIENQTNDRGVFLGGSEISIEELSRKVKLPLSELVDGFNEIIKKLSKHTDQESLEFDTMFYIKESNEIDWYKIVEINYRRTMGQVIHALSDRFGQGLWKIEKNNSLLTNHLELEKKLQKKYGKKICITSPLNSKSLSYYVY